MSRGDAEVLLRYSQAIFRAVTEQRRRQATAALIVAVLFGLISLWSLAQWVTTRNAVAEVPDDPLIEVVGVGIPDPRPALQRGELRLRAFVWGAAAVASGTMLLLGALAYFLVRPTPLPRHLRALDAADVSDQPPIYDISTRSPPDADDRSSE